MKVTAIDYVLKAIERKADSIGYAIDDNQHYIAMCAIITDYTFNDWDITIEEKEYVLETLRNLCVVCGLDYKALLLDADLEVWDTGIFEKFFFKKA